MVFTVKPGHWSETENWVLYEQFAYIYRSKLYAQKWDFIDSNLLYSCACPLRQIWLHCYIWIWKYGGKNLVESLLIIFWFGAKHFIHLLREWVSDCCLMPIQQFFSYIVARTSYYPLANEIAKGYRNATVRPSVTSLWTL